MDHLRIGNFFASDNEIAYSKMIHLSLIDNFSMKQILELTRFDMNFRHYAVTLPWQEGCVVAIELNRINAFAIVKSRLLKENVKLEKDSLRNGGIVEQIFEPTYEGYSSIIVEPLKLKPKDGLPIWYMPLVVET